MVVPPPGATRLVVDDDGLAELLLQRSRDHARGGIGGTARREGDDDLDGAARPLLRGCFAGQDECGGRCQDSSARDHAIPP
jgi:hypothetical protein